MRCPYCGNPDTKVVDSRPTEEGQAIRRRRECESCEKRFTTYETVEEIPLMVIKKDGSRETFDRNKLTNGIIRACEKRPVPMAEIDKIVSDIENGLSNMMKN
jgi:transcriptional repressor NrdR